MESKISKAKVMKTFSFLACYFSAMAFYKKINVNLLIKEIRIEIIVVCLRFMVQL